jgi:hypothetical protein
VDGKLRGVEHAALATAAGRLIVCSVAAASKREILLPRLVALGINLPLPHFYAFLDLFQDPLARSKRLLTVRAGHGYADGAFFWRHDS